MFRTACKIKEPEVDEVLVSYTHADPVYYASFLHREILLYMGQTTQNMIKAIQERRSLDAINREILEFKVNDRDQDTMSKM